MFTTWSGYGRPRRGRHMHMSNIAPGTDISQHTSLPGTIESKQTFGMRQPKETEETSGEEGFSSLLLLVVGVNAGYI